MEDKRGLSYKLQTFAPDGLEMIPEVLPYISLAKTHHFLVGQEGTPCQAESVARNLRVAVVVGTGDRGDDLGAARCVGHPDLGQIGTEEGQNVHAHHDPRWVRGTTTIVDEGTYVIDRDGTWEQTSQLVQAEGAYSLEKDTLTVETVKPKLNGGTIRWKRVKTK